MTIFSVKTTIKVTKGQICDDTMSKIMSTIYVESFIVL